MTIARGVWPVGGDPIDKFQFERLVHVAEIFDGLAPPAELEWWRGDDGRPHLESSVKLTTVRRWAPRWWDRMSDDAKAAWFIVNVQGAIRYAMDAAQGLEELEVERLDGELPSILDACFELGDLANNYTLALAGIKPGAEHVDAAAHERARSIMLDRPGEGGGHG